MLVNRKLPSLPVVVWRVKPLTGLMISTVAFAITPPDGSLITPSMEPELPNCALATHIHNANWVTKIRQLRKTILIISPGRFGRCCGCSGRPAGITAGARPVRGALRGLPTAAHLAIREGGGPGGGWAGNTSGIG